MLLWLARAKRYDGVERHACVSCMPKTVLKVQVRGVRRMSYFEEELRATMALMTKEEIIEVVVKAFTKPYTLRGVPNE
jgi:hypothetical protein